MYRVEIALEAIPEIFNNREIVQKVPELFDRDANKNRLVASANYFSEQEERQSFTVFCEDIKGVKKLADKYFIKVMEYILEKCQDDIDEDDVFHYNLDISKNASAAISILKAIIISESIKRRGFYFSYEDGGSVLFDMNVVPIEKFMLSDKDGIFMLTGKENNALVTVQIPYVSKYYETDKLNEKPKLFNDSVVSDEDKYIINQIVDFFAQFTLVELTQIIHNQKPWKKTYQEGKDNIITVSCIKENF